MVTVISLNWLSCSWSTHIELWCAQMYTAGGTWVTLTGLFIPALRTNSDATCKDAVNLDHSVAYCLILQAQQ